MMHIIGATDIMGQTCGDPREVCGGRGHPDVQALTRQVRPRDRRRFLHSYLEIRSEAVPQPFGSSLVPVMSEFSQK